MSDLGEREVEDLTEVERETIARLLEARASEWESRDRSGYAFRNRELARRVLGERAEPVLGTSSEADR